ncbi:AraC family transcriptional regulator [Trinickia sp. LjRoot230]|uniref:AraC family transcriptional regulator n=1 Tax=Trinickia sp. LjRoot230 TaxID=3342288 RepID=UPI003ED02FF5
MSSGLDFPRMGEVVRIPDTPMMTLQPVEGSFCAVSRTRTQKFGHGQNAPYAQLDGYLVGVHMQRLDAYEIWLKGRYAESRPLDAGALWFHHMELEAQVDFGSPFDILCTYVPHLAISEWAAAEGLKGAAGHLCCPALGARDPIIEQLSHCLSGALSKDQRANTLFAESVLQALIVHLALNYGSGLKPSCSAKAALASWQENRAKEFIDANLGGKCSLIDMANQCGLSPSHFVRAFKATVGMPPHRWLMLRRIEMAKGMLRESDKSLTEIAGEVGFANQSHFTHAFARENGCTPSDWRRFVRCRATDVKKVSERDPRLFVIERRRAMEQPTDLSVIWAPERS